ncbi:MAG: HWE histidine kinase domain-containing protein [Rhodospirillaceae bacterium]
MSTIVAPVRFGDVDLTSCDREPIDCPGSIQPHGVLLVFDRRDLAIRQVAGDALALLGLEPRGRTALTLFDLFETEALGPMVERLAAPARTVAPSILLGLAPRLGQRRLNATIHAEDELGIIELEPAIRAGATVSGDAMSLVKAMVAAVQAVDGFEAGFRIAAVQVRAALGFDRVMVYRFLRDGSGTVVAEDMAEGLESFLGLHYPASDLPRQARALYQRNWLRLIPDAGYGPAPLEAVAAGDTGAAPDMSQCILRSVSPVHLEYLKNMGVAASLSISILHQQTLWGLIACHHRTPRHVTADLRAACELFGQIFSFHMAAWIEADSARRRIKARAIQESLTARLLQSPDAAIPSVLVAGGGSLLDLIGSSGVAVWLEGELHTAGETPPAAFIAELVSWLAGQPGPVIETCQLSAVFPPALPFVTQASGLLAVSLSHRTVGYVMWFRAEWVRSITWAGDPRKPVEVGPLGERLTPRRSFDAWREDTRQQAAPWEAMDIEVAHGFRHWLLETVLRQVDRIRRERETALERQSLLMAELDHRVKNTLASIQAIVWHSMDSSTSLEGFAGALVQRVHALAYAHGLMAAAHGKGVAIRDLIESELAPFRSAKAAKANNLRVAGADIVRGAKVRAGFRRGLIMG